MDPGLSARVEGLAAADIARLQSERQSLEDAFLRACDNCGALSLDLALLASYLRVLLDNPRLDRCLAARHVDIHAELQRIAASYRADRRPRKRPYKRPAEPPPS